MSFACSSAEGAAGSSKCAVGCCGGSASCLHTHYWCVSRLLRVMLIIPIITIVVFVFVIMPS